MSKVCPDEDRNGFVFEDEFSPDWNFLDQTRVLIYHSGIAEFAFVGNITGWFTLPMDLEPELSVQIDPFLL